VRLRGFVFCPGGSAVWLQCWLCAVCAVGHIGCCVGGGVPCGGKHIIIKSHRHVPRAVPSQPFSQLSAHICGALETPHDASLAEPNGLLANEGKDSTKAGHAKGRSRGRGKRREENKV